MTIRSTRDGRIAVITIDRPAARNAVDGPSALGLERCTTTSATPPMGVTRLALGKPLIAAIAGHAVAGGLELALWCEASKATDPRYRSSPSGLRTQAACSRERS